MTIESAIEWTKSHTDRTFLITKPSDLESALGHPLSAPMQQLAESACTDWASKPLHLLTVALLRPLLSDLTFDVTTFFPEISDKRVEAQIVVSSPDVADDWALGRALFRIANNYRIPTFYAAEDNQWLSQAANECLIQYCADLYLSGCRCEPLPAHRRAVAKWEALAEGAPVELMTNPRFLAGRIILAGAELATLWTGYQLEPIARPFIAPLYGPFVGVLDREFPGVGPLAAEVAELLLRQTSVTTSAAFRTAMELRDWCAQRLPAGLPLTIRRPTGAWSPDGRRSEWETWKPTAPSPWKS